MYHQHTRPSLPRPACHTGVPPRHVLPATATRYCLAGQQGLLLGHWEVGGRLGPGAAAMPLPPCRLLQAQGSCKGPDALQAESGR